MSYAADTLYRECRQLAETSERLTKDIAWHEDTRATLRESLRQVRDARMDVLDKLRQMGEYELADELEEPPP